MVLVAPGRLKITNSLGGGVVIFYSITRITLLTLRGYIDIICLTREPKARLRLAAGKLFAIKISALVCQTEGAYFLRFISVTTRVMTVQIIITNVNKSPYVTIRPTPFIKSSGWYNRPFGSPVKHIILSKCIYRCISKFNVCQFLSFARQFY